MKVDITSKPVELLLETVKEFVTKIAGPSLDELGMIPADYIRSWRFKNQLNILNKAQELLRKKGIEPKKISLKALVPLLESSSLEEDESLQEKWAALLANAVTSANDSTTLFVYILSQLSKKDVDILQHVYNNTVKENEFAVGMIDTPLNLQNLMANAALSLDNLERLNLVRSIPTYGSGSSTYYLLTTLGMSFVFTCRH